MANPTNITIISDLLLPQSALCPAKAVTFHIRELSLQHPHLFIVLALVVVEVDDAVCEEGTLIAAKLISLNSAVLPHILEGF